MSRSLESLDRAQRLHPDLLLIASTGWNPAGRPPDRHLGRLPVILLSTKAGSTGADLHDIDDLIPPDANGDEAAIWIRAVLRRERPTGLTNRMRQGTLEVDHSLRRVTCAGRPVPVTFAEFNLLALLMEAPGRVWSYSELARALWGHGHGFKDDSSRQVIRTLSRKIVAVAGSSPIMTVEKRGYRFDP